MTESTLSQRQRKTRLALMNALLALVVERGFDQVTVTDIANAANYGRWTFYQYFASKEEAAYAAILHWMTRLDAQVIEAVHALPWPRREYESWRLLFQAFHQQRDFLTRLDSALFSGWRVRVQEFLIAQFLGHLHSGRFRLMEGVRPEITARLYVTALMGLLEHWGQHPELGDAETLVDEFYAFIFHQPPPK